MSASSVSQTSTPREVVIRFLELMTTGAEADRDQAMQLFAEDATLWIAGNLPYSGTRHGRTRIIDEVYRHAGGRMVPGSKTLTIGTIVAEGDFVAVEWTSRRTLVVTGKPYENELCGFFRVENGKIKLMREYLDTLHAKVNNWPDPPAQPKA